MGVVARAHDLLVNTDMGDMKQPEWMVRVKEDYFKAGQSMFESREIGELLDEMDEMGVERCVLMTNMTRSSERVLSFVEQRPDRFSLGLGGHNLLRPTSAIHEAGHQVAHMLGWNDELSACFLRRLQNGSEPVRRLWSRRRGCRCGARRCGRNRGNERVDLRARGERLAVAIAPE